MSRTKLRKALFETPLYEPQPTTIILPKLECQAALSGHLDQSLWGFENLLGFDVWLHDYQLPESDLGIGPWRLQLLPTPLLTLPPFSERRNTFGLKYQLFYHSHMLGAVELLPEEFAREFAPNAPEDHYLLSIYALINHAPLLPYDHVRRFLFMCAFALQYEQSRLGQANLNHQVQSAVIKCMWEAARTGNDRSVLTFHYEGAVHKDSRRFADTPHSYAFENVSEIADGLTCARSGEI